MKAPSKHRHGQKIVGRFVALPHFIIDSQEYRALPLTAKARRHHLEAWVR